MFLIGLDPSYSRTGLAIGSTDSTEWDLHSISRPGNNKNITHDMENAHQLVKEIKQYVQSIIDSGEPIIWGVEYPIMSTLAGAYLSFITSKIDSYLRSHKQPMVYYLPSIACACYTKTRDKATLVNWVHSSGFITKPQRFNHDVATAVVLAKIAQDCHEKKYKKSFFFRDYSKVLEIKEPKSKK